MSTGLSGRLFAGFVIPVVVEVVAAIVIVSTESGASAGPFAYVVVLLMLMCAIPITLLANVLFVPSRSAAVVNYYRRSMILPACFIAAVLVYHTGMWDKAVKPHLPRHTENIQTAGSGPFGENGYRAYFVINTYSGTSEDDLAIDAYAAKKYLEMTQTNSNYLNLNVYFYFVAREQYDPMDDAVSRERAVATFFHPGTDKRAVIERVDP